MDSFHWEYGVRLGQLLVAAIIAGKVAERVRLPKVTAYLLIGLALGPSLLDIAALPYWSFSDQVMHALERVAISDESLHAFQPFTALAIALVLFNLGCAFPLARARKIFHRVARLSFGELSTTFVLVSIGCALLGMPWYGAVLLGALALATAPATTILVLKETESEGQVTEFTNALVALNNLTSIVLFEILFLAMHFFVSGSGEKEVASLTVFLTDIGHLGMDLLGSVGLGVLAGLIVSVAYGLVDGEKRLVALLAVMVPMLAICKLHDMPYLLTFLAMGVTVANASEHSRQIVSELDRLTGFLCVIFFVVHGAELEIGKLPAAGVVGVGYIVLRLLGKYFGVYFAAKRGKEEPAVRRYLGATLLAQAGAAIALSTIAVERTDVGTAFHDVCLNVQLVILGTVAVFEIVGPIAIQKSVLYAGEVPLAHAISRAPGPSFLDVVRGVANRLMFAVGLDPWRKRDAEGLTVRELMRTNEKPIAQTATFESVVHAIEQSRNHAHPVVTEAGSLVGVIRYEQLSTALFDPAVGGLVLAADVMTPAEWVLHPDQSAIDAYAVFETCKDDMLPVVTPDEERHYVGAVRRRDILRLLIRKKITTN